jgi:DNA-binding response OmpR family regulator
VHIHGLRAVPSTSPSIVPLIQTRHGIGYRIAPPENDA